MGAQNTDGDPISLRGLAVETAQMLRFYSSLPIPRLPFEDDAHAAPDFARSVRMLPLAGLIIACPALIAMQCLALLWLPAALISIAAVGATMLATGALHEDGLADTADGLGGGNTIERRLQIMRDSAIGTYGAAALIVAITTKLVCLTTLIDRQGLHGAMLVFGVAAMMSRVAALIPLWNLRPAREDGRSRSVGKPSTGAMLAAALIVLFAAMGMLHDFGLVKIGIALGGAAWIAFCMAGLAKRRLGGHTGDIVGATQQIAECVFLVLMNASWDR